MPQDMKALKDNTKHEEMKSKHSYSCSSPSSSSNFPSSFGEKQKCSHKAIEFACSACLCVCCPIIALWWCVKVPFRIGRCLVRKGKYKSCCGTNKRVFAVYSSFSDSDSDLHTMKQGSRKHCCHAHHTISQDSLIEFQAGLE